MLMTKQRLHNFRAGSNLQNHKLRVSLFETSLQNGFPAWTPSMMSNSLPFKETNSIFGQLFKVWISIVLLRKKKMVSKALVNNLAHGEGYYSRL